MELGFLSYCFVDWCNIVRILFYIKKYDILSAEVLYVTDRILFRSDHTNSTLFVMVSKYLHCYFKCILASFLFLFCFSAIFEWKVAYTTTDLHNPTHHHQTFSLEMNQAELTSRCWPIKKHSVAALGPFMRDEMQGSGLPTWNEKAEIAEMEFCHQHLCVLSWLRSSVNVANNAETLRTGRTR